MNSERWERAKEIYSSALEVEPGRRDTFVSEACDGDQSLLEEVRSLLAQQGKSEDLFESPPLEVAAQALAEEKAHKPPESLIGHTVSHYRIEEKIGKGGMGEVFLAHDNSLNRNVALKFLAPEVQPDPVAHKRFLREARSAAALDHPCICSIHEVGELEGKDFIVMEYVDGQTLTEKLRRGRLPLSQALQIATEVAEAVQAAHEKGIIHRDLKPSNIMLTKTGHAKVMDFGLAKQTVPSGEIASQGETVTALTRSGMTFGTIAYMSPEQVRGEGGDARSDIFSFGLVLYEVLARTHPFWKESPIETASSILHEEAKPVSAITKGIPASLEKLIERCLRKDPERRMQHMDDVKLALMDLKADLDSGRLEVPPDTARKGRSVLRLVTGTIAVVALIVVAVAGWYWLGRHRGAEPEAPMTAVPLTSYLGYETFPSFSPDGTQVVFQWCPEGWAHGKNCDIYVKQIGVDSPYRLTDTSQQEFSPAWSPDGQFIAFLRQLSTAKVAMVLMPQRGGRERVLVDIDMSNVSDNTAGPYVAWTPDSKFVVTPVPEAGRDWAFYLFSVETGERRRLINPPAEKKGYMGGEATPAFSPDGRILAFARILLPASDLYLLRLAEDYRPGGEAERAPSENPYNVGVAWTPDGKEIVFASPDAGLYRVAASASAKPERLPFVSENARAPAISRQGHRLVYAVPRRDTNIWRIRVEGPNHRPDIPVQLISSTWHEYEPDFSPDGKRIAFGSDRSGTHQIWVCDSDGSNSQQISSFGRSFQFGGGIRWSPDGQSIAFYATDSGNMDVYVLSANGGMPLQRLTTDPAGDQWPYWSRDGQSIYFKSSRGGTGRAAKFWQIWKMPASGGKAVQIGHDPDGIDLPKESPDGRFVYYSKGFPNAQSVWRVAVEGGEATKVLDGVHPEALWTVGADGIYFFRTPDEKGHSDLCISEFATRKTRKILTVERPLEMDIAVSRDGRTVIYPQVDEAGSDLMLVENFH